MTSPVRLDRSLPAARAQKGAALLIILVMLIVGGAYVALTGLNAATADVKLRREQSNAAVLRQAKDALIAWSAMYASQGPGHLPCPDRDNDGASEGAACGAFDTRIGRLPWRTLGLPDLRDASGERLWYVLSANFINGAGRPVNSDTPGTLQVTGAAPASSVVAIIFAPGAIVTKADGTLQNRSGATPCAAFTDALCSPENFLERENADAANDVYVAMQQCLQNAWGCGAAFNDELIVITHEDLFSIVEPVVARRIETEVGKALRDYYAAWNVETPGSAFYPFAVPFDAAPNPIPVANGLVADQKPYQDQFLGRIDQTNGLLPMSTNTEANPVVVPAYTNSVSWLGAPTYTELGPSRVTAFTCPTVGANNARCTFTVAAGPMPLTVTITGNVKNVSRAFFLPIPNLDPALMGVSTVLLDGNPVPSTQVTQVFDPAAGGRLDVTVTLVFPPTMTPSTAVEVVIPTPQPSPLVDTTLTTFDWFRKNYWYSQVYYAMHPRFGAFTAPKPLSAAANSCASTPMPAPCMTLQSTSGTQSDVAVIAVLAGRDRANAAPRPWTFARYFEGQNLSSPMSVIIDPATDPDYAFETRLREPAFNDRVVVIARRP